MRRCRWYRVSFSTAQARKYEGLYLPVWQNPYAFFME